MWLAYRLAAVTDRAWYIGGVMGDQRLVNARPRIGRNTSLLEIRKADRRIMWNSANSSVGALRKVSRNNVRGISQSVAWCCYLCVLLDVLVQSCKPHADPVAWLLDALVPPCFLLVAEQPLEDVVPWLVRCVRGFPAVLDVGLMFTVQDILNFRDPL